MMNESNVYERKSENADFHVLALKNDADDDAHENGAHLVFIILLKKLNLHFLNLFKKN